MGKKTLIGIGVAILCLGSVGVYNAINDFGKAPEEKSDLTTVGTVTSVEGEELQIRVTGTAIDSHFKMKYSFVATDGEKYHDYETINQHQFRSLQKGDSVTVLYHSNNPWISTAKGYGTYLGVDAFPDSDPKTRLMGCSAVAGFGLLVIVASFFCKEDENAGNSNYGQAASTAAQPEKFSDNPMEALEQWRQEQMAQ